MSARRPYLRAHGYLASMHRLIFVDLMFWNQRPPPGQHHRLKVAWSFRGAFR